MEFREYRAAIQRRWPLILLTTLLGVLGGVGLTLTQDAQYQATAQVFVGATSGDTTDRGEAAFGTAQLAAARFPSYENLLKSNRVLAEVESSFGQDLSTTVLAKSLSLEGEVGSALMEVTATLPDPDEAARLANLAAVAFAQEAQEIESQTGGQAVLTVVDKAVPQPLPVTAGVARMSALGAIVGLLVGLALAVILHQFDSRVRRFSDLPRNTGLRDLGAIRAASSKTTADASPSATATRADDIRSLRASLSTATDDLAAAVIAVSAVADGSHSADVAVELARSFAQAGERVVLVDADLREPRVAGLMGLANTPGLWDVLTNRQDVASCLESDSDSGLIVLPAGAADRNPADALATAGVADLLVSLRRDHDRVVVHGSALLGFPDTAEFARHLDGVVVLSRCNATTREQLADAAALLERVGATALGVVITDVPSRQLSGAGQAATVDA